MYYATFKIVRKTFSKFIDNIMELWAGTKIEAVIQTRSVKEVFLDISQHLQEKHLRQSLFFNKVAGNFIKKETLAQVFSCKFCEKNTFLYRTPLVAAFAKRKADTSLLI